MFMSFSPNLDITTSPTFYLQRIWQEETLKLTKEAREKCERKKCLRAMTRARRTVVPSSPRDLEEIVDNFDKKTVYPSEYQEMYLGSVTRKIRG
jgi:hypothetical protein